MSELIQITTPTAPRDYAQNNNQNRQNDVRQNPTGQVFDLGNQMQVVKTNDRGGENAERNLKDEGSGVLMRSSADAVKNPSSALNAAKELISTEALNLVKESGDAEALSKLTEFAAEVMLNPSNLAADMAAQQKNATIFGDKLWSVLKDIVDFSAKDGFMGAEELKAAVADFAKAAANVSSKDEILRSLSANFKFLSLEAAPSKAVSDELAAASKALSGPDAAANFASLKPTLLKLLGFTEHSLLLNDNTKNLLPLIVHNMSRYNDDPEALRESFDSLLMMTESLNISPEAMEKMGLDKNFSPAENLEKLFDSYIKDNEYLPPEAKQAALISPETASHEAGLRSAVNLLAAGAKHMAARIPEDTLTRVLSTVDFTEGDEAVRKLLGAVIPNTPAMRNALQTVFDELEATKDLDALIDRLNVILENIDSESSEKMISLAQGLNTALGEMAQSGEYKISAATSMETLTDFLSKNINSSILHSLSGATKSDMVQNMLTAPGVFTPLLHQFVPLDAFGIRAFGELWVDPKAEELIENKKKGSRSGGEGGSHMLLCFDIEDTGYFELEIYEQDRNMTVMLLCPEKLESTFAPIRETIPKIAEANGYHVSAALVEGLKEKRSLDRVFPKLGSQRGGLNVKV
ncbi:MAG: hypothetical protein ACI4J0_08140 [Huintestinicola sp.]|uniref:hypothetical protein n=1 Tax=Huintestinicola sp. TaxID=2981661 RepID=UPI003EFF521F